MGVELGGRKIIFASVRLVSGGCINNSTTARKGCRFKVASATPHLHRGREKVEPRKGERVEEYCLLGVAAR